MVLFELQVEIFKNPLDRFLKTEQKRLYGLSRKDPTRAATGYALCVGTGAINIPSGQEKPLAASGKKWRPAGRRAGVF